MAERRLGALLAAAREARPERAMPPLRAAAATERSNADRAAAEILARYERRVPGTDLPNPSYERPFRGRHLADDDLFDDEPLTLDQVHGVRR